MAEWWSYTPSDFLMYSLRTYLRLIESQHQQLWPWQLLALTLGLALMFDARRLDWRRIAAVAVAAVWLAVAWWFLWQRMAGIHWGMRYAALAFALQAMVLLGFAWRAREGWLPRGYSARRRAVVIALLLAVVPLVSLGLGRGPQQLECFGITADSTALITLAWLAGLRLSQRLLMSIIPLLWCLFSLMTWWALSTAEFGLMAASLAIALFGPGRAAARRH